MTLRKFLKRKSLSPEQGLFLLFFMQEVNSKSFYRSDYLYHHGILGQRWGKRNGPPYPLDAQDHSASEKKALSDEDFCKAAFNDFPVDLTEKQYAELVESQKLFRTRFQGST